MQSILRAIGGILVFDVTSR